MLTLQELSKGLVRFALSPELQEQAMQEKEVADLACSAWLNGEELPDSDEWSHLDQAARGADPDTSAKEAVRLAHVQLLRDSKDRTRSLFSAWSPTYYPSAAPKRSTFYLIHLSCLVLQYRPGISIDDASSDWSNWYHIVYTSWSHTWESHRFRIVLPLANPVYLDDWSKLWTWAEDRSGKMLEPSTGLPDSVYALPTVPYADWPRFAAVHGGALLDPLIKGIVDDSPRPPVFDSPAEDSHFRTSGLNFVTG